MSDNPKQEYEIPPFLVKLCEFKDRDFNLLFWFTSLLTIPIFVMMLSLPVVLVAWILSLPFESLSKTYSSQIDTAILFISLALAIWVQFKLWKGSKTWMNSYKNNKNAA